MDLKATEKLIRDHEGVRSRVYPDSEGILTIGVGFNLQKNGATQRIAALSVDYNDLCAGNCELNDDQVDKLFEDDLNTAVADAKTCVSNFSLHPEDVQTAIVDMVFNLGVTRFSKFTATIAALEADPPDYCKAAVEMRDSAWAKQVPNRANDDIALVQQFCQP
jgi:GH24 family phage-related lysozyme (muramidase)